MKLSSCMFNIWSPGRQSVSMCHSNECHILTVWLQGIDIYIYIPCYQLGKLIQFIAFVLILVAIMLLIVSDVAYVAQNQSSQREFQMLAQS